MFKVYGTSCQPDVRISVVWLAVSNVISDTLTVLPVDTVRVEVIVGGCIPLASI